MGAGAEAHCENVFHSHLASVHSKFDNDELLNLVGESKIWIGLYYSTITNGWVWTDKSTYDFEDWYPGQPSENGDCVKNNFQSNGWDDDDCDELKAFACNKLKGIPLHFIIGGLSIAFLFAI